MYGMLKVDQGPFKGGTMFVESAMSNNDDDDGLNEHHLITSNVVSDVMHQAQRKFFKEHELEAQKGELYHSVLLQHLLIKPRYALDRQ